MTNQQIAEMLACYVPYGLTIKHKKSMKSTTTIEYRSVKGLYHKTLTTRNSSWYFILENNDLVKVGSYKIKPYLKHMASLNDLDAKIYGYSSTVEIIAAIKDKSINSVALLGLISQKIDVFDLINLKIAIAL